MELSPQAISLIHNIELSDVDWRNRSIKRFLISSVAQHGPIATFELPAIVRRELGVSIDRPTVDEMCEELVIDGDFARLADDRVKLSEAAAEQVNTDVANASEERRRLEDRFLRCLVEAELDIDPANAWDDFESEYLTPVVRELGARTYELLVAQAPAEEETLTSLIAKASSSRGPAFREAVVRFLDPDVTLGHARL